MSTEAPAAASESDAAAPEPETHAGALVSRSCGQVVVHPTGGQYLAVVSALKAEGYALCADLSAVDYLTHPGRVLPPGIAPERFEVAVNLLSLTLRRRIRVRVQVPAGEPSLASLYDLYPGTEAMEREAYDLLGIVFEGHPDLSRILLPDDWEGHPLRKDYAQGRIPVQFKGAPAPR